VVGSFAGLLFALFSYLFWVFAVGVVAGSLGYALVAGLFLLFDADISVVPGSSASASASASCS
jgi:hypothetical protein